MTPDQHEPRGDRLIAALHRSRAQWHSVLLAGCDHTQTHLVSSSLHAPAEARRFVADEFCLAHAGLSISALSLVASELVTDAVLSGRGPLLRLTLACEVTTSSLSVTWPLDAPPRRSGFELRDAVSHDIIASIARDAGTVTSEDETTVWCTIPTGYVPRRWARRLS